MGSPYSLIVVGLLSAALAVFLVSLVFKFTIRQLVGDLIRSPSRRIPVIASTWISKEFKPLITYFQSELSKQGKLGQELLGNIAHDIRGPITSIKGYAETLLTKNKSLKEEEREDFISVILENANSLHRMIDDFLELIRLDIGVKSPRNESFTVTTLVKRVTRNFEAPAKIKNIQFTVELCNESPIVIGDEVMLERALGNILDNAIKYTSSGGSVSVAVVGNEDTIIISVKDSGIGIAKDYIARVFERFYRIEKDRSSSTGGLGIGLSITQEIMRLHQGAIDMQSIENKGTLVTLSLPRNSN